MAPHIVLTPRPLLYFDVELTEHCNLNCKSCGSLAPLAEKEFVDVDELKRDLERLSALSGGEAHHINLLGGEPLLHPRVNEIMCLARHNFPIQKISRPPLLNRVKRKIRSIGGRWLR